ncbi:MAG: DEAD/DEAH box helicase [Flavobacteriales bacterium]|nr:DEAD/DEAH box helicase [Flavobacteriales bacterium]
MTKFSDFGLRAEVLKGIGDLGFVTPTPIQEKVIPEIINNRRDIVGLAQTGTGKTAAFGLPLLEWADPSSRTPTSLVLAPTRELCVQIAKDLASYAKYLGKLKVLPVYGGTSITNQIRDLKNGVQILVATPGRLIDLVERRAANLSGVEIVVLDEADEMLNMGFIDDINTILSSCPSGRTTMLFSATMPREIQKLAGRYMNNPLEIAAGDKNASTSQVEHHYYYIREKDRYLALKRIVDFYPGVYGIVFCKTKMDTQRVADKLMEDGYDAEPLHGDLSQQQRDRVMDKFRNKNVSLLVATDVAARGIDVNNLSHVINYNLPDDIETYTHRSGRTGRAGRTGISLVLVNTKERGKIRQIENQIKQKFEKKLIPEGAEICRVQLFNLIDKIEKTEASDSDIEPFLPEIFARFESFSREDLIRKIVSEEFHRFLIYYQNSASLNVPEGSDKDFGRDDRRERGGRSKGRDRGFGGSKKGYRNDSENYSRLFINCGKMDELNPQRLMGIVNDAAKGKRVQFGKIEILDKFSFFEVERNAQKGVLESLNKFEWNNRRIKVEPSERRGPR